MIQQKNSNTLPSQASHTPNYDTYAYKETQVKIITVFTDNGKSTALVEDENGELFEVERDSLK